VLSTAVRRLQGDPAKRQGTADLDEHTAVAGRHVAQGSAGAVDEAEVRDGGRPLEVLRRDLHELGEDPDHRVVDPHLDRPELSLDLVRGGVDLLVVCDVGHDGEPAAARGGDVGDRSGQAVLTARQHGDVVAGAGEGPDDRPAEPG